MQIGIVDRIFGKVVRTLKWSLLRVFVDGSAAARSLGVRVGTGCRILRCDFGSEPWLVSIGDRVTVASFTHFITHDGSTWLLRDERGRRYRYSPIEVGNDVFIGSGCTILPGVKIGNRVVIGACSLVNRSIPDNCVVAGVPARYIGDFDEFERRGLAANQAEQDMRGTTHRERIDSIVRLERAPELKVQRPAERQQSVRD